MKESDCIVTGHYADIVEGRLKISKDLKKDQTYFLCTTEGDWGETFFPLANWFKNETTAGVRALLHDVGLGEYDKKDSTGICMIPGKNDLSSLIKDFEDELSDADDAEVAEVNIVLNDEIIGSTDSKRDPKYYTIGQRVPLNGYPKKLFMLRRDALNVHVVDDTKDSRLYSSILECDSFNWMLDSDKEAYKGKALGRIRHGQPLIPCTYSRTKNNGVKVEWEKCLRAVAKGQVCCLYDEQGFVIGGGVISWTGGEVEGMEKAKSGDNDKSVA